MPTKLKPALHIFSASIVLLLLVQASIAKDAPSPQDLAPKGSSGGKVTATGHWIPDGAVELKGIKRGKYLHMGEGRLLCIAGNEAALSTDRPTKAQPGNLATPLIWAEPATTTAQKRRPSCSKTAAHGC